MNVMNGYIFAALLLLTASLAGAQQCARVLFIISTRQAPAAAVVSASSAHVKPYSLGSIAGL
jgi:hypothetical protein